MATTSSGGTAWSSRPRAAGGWGGCHTASRSPAASTRGASEGTKGNRVSIVDVPSGAIAGDLAVPGVLIRALALNGDGSSLYAATSSGSGSGQLAVVDTSTMTLVYSMALPGIPT